MDIELSHDQEERLRALAREAGKTPQAVVSDLLDQAMSRPLNGTTNKLTSAADFLDNPETSLEQLVRSQGIQPITNLDELVADFWPADENADDILTAVRSWRAEGADFSR